MFGDSEGWRLGVSGNLGIGGWEVRRLGGLEASRLGDSEGWRPGGLGSVLV